MGGTKGKASTDAGAIEQDAELDAAADGATQDADGAAQRLQDGHDEARAEAFDAEGQHTLAVDRIERMAEEVMLNSDELVFDLRDTLLEIIKTRPKPWSGTSQAEQRDVAAALEIAAKELVRKTVELIASNGTASIRVLLTKFNMSGTEMVITGKVKCHDERERDDAIKTLSHSLNKHVMLTRASAEDYVQGEREAETDLDEPGFGFEGGDDDEQEEEQE